MRFFKILSTLFILFATTGLALGDDLATYQPDETYELQNAIYVSGYVRKVRTGESLVDLKTPEGQELTVPLSALPNFDTGNAGYQELRSGLHVKARAAEGVLGLEPAQNGMFWVTVDGKKFVSLHPNDIHDEVFDHDTQEVRLEDGREVKISLEEFMQRGILQLEL